MYRDHDREAEADLFERIDLLSGLGVDHLAILFDDMRGDRPNLAESQLRLLDLIRRRWSGREMSFCPLRPAYSAHHSD
jgi:hypothetical protein